VPPQLADDPQAKNGVLLGVMQNVDLPEGKQDLSLELFHGVLRKP